MSRLSEIKNHYPELNVSIIDVLSKVDGTKSHKYLPLLCKLFNERFVLEKNFKNYSKTELKREINYIKNSVSKSVDIDNLSDNDIFVLHSFLGFFNEYDIQLMKTFKELNERNLIPNNDVTSYNNLDEIRNAVSLGELRQNEKEMSKQIFKEYEDENWLFLRPLTFSASSRYGSSTKWCTTYKSDKHYFMRYWQRGILVYAINKITGYKFAIFKALSDGPELSFWNSADQRIDFLEVDIEDYMFPVIKNILKSKKTNKDFCDNKLIMSVEMECNEVLEKKLSVEPSIDVTEGEIAPPQFENVRNGGVILHREFIVDETERDGEEIGYDMMENSAEDMGEVDFQMEERYVEPGVIRLRRN
jgi:hypothetical protein